MAALRGHRNAQDVQPPVFHLEHSEQTAQAARPRVSPFLDVQLVKNPFVILDGLWDVSMKYADGYGKHGWSLVSLPLGAFIFILGPSLSLASRFHPLAAKTQSTATPSPESRATCPPDVKGEPPTVGGGSSEPLSDKLARSKGVICPPAAVDREMQVTPPSGGHLKVIPPPGTPGGDPDVHPK
jgi:hypothetical protein